LKIYVERGLSFACERIKVGEFSRDVSGIVSTAGPAGLIFLELLPQASFGDDREV
jgi:hypothetical protein